jgi:hypothetical protein
VKKMNLKKTVKKIAAIAGSATMLGATMFGAIAAADLSTLTDKTGASEFYTTNGELNAFIAVGAGAAVTDVAGAIDLAAAFAQKATLGGEGGGALVAKNVTPGYLQSSGLTDSVALGASTQAETFQSTTTGFDWLLNETVVFNDTSYFIEEKISTSGLNSMSTDSLYYYWYTQGGIKYNISCNETMKVNFDGFTIAGSTYEIVGLDTTNDIVELGQLQPVEGVNIGESVPIGTGGVTAKLDDVRQTQTAWKAVFSIYDESGNLAESNIQKEPGATYTNTTLGITLKVDTLYRDANDVWNIDFQWTESSVKIKGTETASNMTTTIFPGYYSKIGWDGAGVQWVSFETFGDSFDNRFPTATFGPGDTADVFGEYFKVIYESVRIGPDTSVDEGTETTVQILDSLQGSATAVTPELIFTDHRGQQVSVDIIKFENVGTVGGGFSQPITPTSEATYAFRYFNTGEIEVWDITSGQTFLQNLTAGQDNDFWANETDAGAFELMINATGATPDVAKFNITLYSFTSNATTPLFDNITYSWDDGEFVWQLTQPDSVVIQYKINDSAFTVGGTEPEYDNFYTAWGTQVAQQSGRKVFTVPELQRVGKIAVGRTTEQTDTVAVGGEIGNTGWVLRSGGGESPVWAFAGPTDQGVSKLDSEYTNNAPVILVGGPLANNLVKTLVDAGDALVDANGTGLVPAANHAYVELVEDAFGTYDALIIAGYGAEDTRMASKVVASQILHGTPLGSAFEGTLLTLKTSGTGVSTIGDVTVETA